MLQICELKKEYSGTKVFDQVSFNVPLKSIVTVTGKNGIGKTTLLNMIGGISAFQGDIVFDSISLKSHYEDFIKVSTFIPNIPFLYDYLTVTEMLDLVTLLAKTDKEKANEFIHSMLIDLELAEFKKILIKNLSLGTKQKVAFIAAFLTSPKLVLFDEPFVNFDRPSMMKVLAFLQDYVAKTNSIILFSTHSGDKEVNDIVTHTIQINGNRDITVMEVNQQ